MTLRPNQVSHKKGIIRLCYTWALRGTLALYCGWLLGRIWGESSWLLDMCFYIPSPALVLLTLLLAVIELRRRHRRMSLAMALLCLLPLLSVALLENSFANKPTFAQGESLRLVHWNVCRGHLGWPAARTHLAGLDTQCCVISELPKGTQTEDLPPHLQAEVFGNLAIMVQEGQLQRLPMGKDDNLRLHAFVWQIRGKQIKIFVMDIPPNPLQRRRPQLLKLREHMLQHQPDLVLGDLNTPRQSRYLRNLPKGYQHAYASAGSGWSYTWPVPLPMLAIDQCLHGPSILPLQYSLHSTLLSDHRLQLFEFSLLADD